MSYSLEGRGLFAPSFSENILEINLDWLGVGHVPTPESITLAHRTGVLRLAEPGYAHPHGQGDVFCHRIGGGLTAEASIQPKPRIST